MGWDEVEAWIRAALANDAGFAPEEADQAAQSLMALPDTIPNDRELQPSYRFYSIRAAETISAAVAASATNRLPGGHRWWEDEGRPWKQAMLHGRSGGAASEAAARIAEAIDAAPDAWDPNWPEAKRFRAVDIPEGVETGDTFIVGDGSGHRGLFRVEVRGAIRGAVLADGWDVLNDEEDAARRTFELLVRVNRDGS
ncbi:MAG TPA: hypothetical protein VK277_04910 [Acidimicrobiales bacterium]|nr:hypothetical protein [Acidimicrobiales bacterium]HLN16080.1 hypothetical protein [Acidimicrobiales bacterium]